jgi:hypothetical protein
MYHKMLYFDIKRKGRYASTKANRSDYSKCTCLVAYLKTGASRGILSYEIRLSRLEMKPIKGSECKIAIEIISTLTFQKGMLTFCLEFFISASSFLHSEFLCLFALCFVLDFEV